MFIAQSLAVVHAAGIVHRDLKPANVVFASGVLKVCDFGIAKVLGDSATCAQTCVGSPYYMSLEQMKGQKYKFDADAWALGCLLYELSFGRTPFEAADGSVTRLGIIGGKYDLPAAGELAEEGPDAAGVLGPSPVRKLLGKLLEPKPAERMTVAALVAGLGEL